MTAPNQLEIHTDASEYGLGAALIQDNRPIAFASKTLTDVETRYANIECECLSVVFGLEKVHTYIYMDATLLSTMITNH